MNTKNRITAATLLAAASLSFSPAAFALGLGDVTVESFFNQPLQVRIDLVTRQSDDLNELTARLASNSDYELIGASRESISVPLTFAVEDIESDPYILVTSSQPITNPVLRLIVEVEWSSGRLLREYTVFLDPPTTSDAAPIPRIEKRESPPPAAAADPVETAGVTEPAEAVETSAPAVSEVRDEPAARPVAQPSQPADGEYGPVASGETLWAIAVDWSRGTGLDINKVMIAIQRENPEAFLRDNINLLKRGAILRMPRIDDVRTISTASAISEVSAQSEEFKGARRAEPATSTSTPLLAEETAAPQEEAGGAEEQAASPEPVDEPQVAAGEPVAEEAEPAPQLELVPPSEDSDLDSAYGFEESEEAAADASVAVSALREDLARTEEELITQQQQNEYLAEKIQELESQLASAQEDSVKDADLANMENRLREERLAREAAAAETAPWYSRLSTWLIGLLVLAAGAAGWLFSRRRGGAEFAGADDSLQDIKDEAEEVLRVLEEPEEEAAEPVEEEPEASEVADSDDEEPADAEPAADKGRSKPDSKQTGDAEVLDEESSDPEIQLDLARAYISMGDKEAARVILEEVGSNGTEEQREEAKKMLDLLVQ